MRLLLPFSASVPVWAFVAALALAFARVPAPFADTGSTVGVATRAGGSADAREILGLASPFTEWSAADHAGRRDGVRPRSTRHRPPPPFAHAPATSRARATNAERLRFLPALAGFRSGVIDAGQSSLPPPQSQV